MRTNSRRDFLKQSAMAGVGFWALGGVAASESRAAAEKLQIACIGVGGKGSSDCDQAGGIGDIVALCDVDRKRLDAKGDRFKKAAKFTDYRELYEKLGDKIDAVVVSTPDHTHAHASLLAMNMGKHVYCQKPLTHDVWEARQMRLTAEKKKVCTQMGNQGTASNGLRRAVEVVRAGVLGPVSEIHVWTNRPVWPQAPRITSRPKPSPVLKWLDWEAWIGPAPMRPFSDERQYNNRGPYHPFNWRGWWDFGTGALGDMACHTANMAFMALQLDAPTSIEAESGKINPETYPAWARITFQFPGRDKTPPIKFVWYEGRNDKGRVLPPKELTKGVNVPGSGSLIVGEKGILYSPNDYGSAYQFLGEHAKDIEAAAKKVPQTLPRNGGGDSGMKQEWAKAIKSGNPKTAMSNFDYAARLTETILLGNIAMKVGEKLDWDADKLTFANSKAANDMVRRTYREGWRL